PRNGIETDTRAHLPEDIIEPGRTQRPRPSRRNHSASISHRPALGPTIRTTAKSPPPRHEKWPPGQLAREATTRLHSVPPVVSLNDLGRDTPAVRDLVTVLPRPRTNGLVLLAVHSGRASRRFRAAPAGRPLPATSPTGVLNVLGKGVTQFLRIFCGEIDLVVDAVETELDRLIRFRPVDVVHERDKDLLRHPIPPAEAVLRSRGAHARAKSFA